MSNDKNIKKKIIIVDDEQMMTKMLKAVLLTEGYDVDTANDIDEAKTGIDHKDYDLIISDIVLGDDTGVDLLREVKRRKLTCPVILITGNPDVDTASDAVRLGAYDYLSKPVENDVLLRTVEKALQHKALVDENIKYRSNLDAMFKSTKEAIIMVDKDLVLLEFNKAAEEICGFPDDAKGGKYESLLKDCSGKCLDAINETITTKLPAEANRFECSNQGRFRRVVSVSTYPLFDHHEKFYGCVLVARDETKLAELESDLRERQQLQNITGKSGKIQNIYTYIEALA